MNFLLNEQQLEMQKVIAGYLSKSWPSTIRHEIYDREIPYEATLWQGLVELGVPALIIPQAYAGMGLEMIDLAVVSEVIGRHAAPAPLLGQVLTAMALIEGGSEAQKKQWLPKLASGEVLAAVALDEDQGSWLPEQWAMPVAKVLSGRKRFVPHGMQADLFLVGLKGGRLALVEGSAAGLKREPQDALDRTRPMAELYFDGVAADLLPESERVSARLLDAALVLLAADAFGGASRCVEMAVEYAKVREQFDQPIGKFQALKHQLATMATDIEPSRGLYWFAAHAFDHVADKSSHAAALAKAHICDRFLQVARDTVEAHGGIGYTWECDVQIYVKRAMFNFAYCGAPAVHFDRAASLAGW